MAARLYRNCRVPTTAVMPIQTLLLLLLLLLLLWVIADLQAALSHSRAVCLKPCPPACLLCLPACTRLLTVPGADKARPPFGLVPLEGRLSLSSEGSASLLAGAGG